jgi:hypothetical protein
MRLNRDDIDPNLSRFKTTIAHSEIAVTLEAAQRFPAGFDDRDVAILQWIAAEGCQASCGRMPNVLMSAVISGQLPMSALPLNVLQNSANERSTSKSGQYQNLKRRFRESKLPIRDLI